MVEDQQAEGGDADPVQVQPPLVDTVQTQSLLTANGLASLVSATGESPVSFVIGFHHNRAAQVTGLEWIDGADDDSATTFESLLVETSTIGPIGPWTALGEFALERNGDRAAITFDEPAWARFVRVTGVAPAISGGDEATPAVEPPEFALPDRVIIRERPIDDDYRSILGEWGGEAPEAIYETLVPPASVTLDDDAGNDAGTAILLDPGWARTDAAAA